MQLLLASSSAKETGIEKLFRQAVALAGLQDQVWLGPPINLPRRCDRGSPVC
ncbi:MAG: hypothetical protein JWL65_2608 [Gammaproteobacteria bacterium]|nr:hypothetical protein [Gammaproteobacteria bacterium]